MEIVRKGPTSRHWNMIRGFLECWTHFYSLVHPEHSRFKTRTLFQEKAIHKR